MFQSAARVVARRVPGAALCAVVAGGMLLAAGPGAGAVVPVTAHDPIGGKVTFTAAPSGILATGWAADPDALGSNVVIFPVVDGYTAVARAVTSLPNASVSKRYRTGPTPGYSLTVPLSRANHTVCIAAANIGHGVSTVLGCTATPFGRTLTAAQTAARNPRGAITGYSAATSTARFRGWATDPDFINRRVLAVLYLDGAPARTVYTTTSTSPRPSGAGKVAAFDMTVPVSTGTHVGCVWIVNIGIGKNTFLGCDAVDTRGRPGTGALPAPALNKAVVNEAKKHIGQPYAWGAQGPRSFDCSGLVVYSYTKEQQALKIVRPFTVQRVSEAQAVQARLIPAARAVPGDLVFTHDTEGDVYHVGIYIKPGVALAAIDYGYGVNYQNIWDPSATTYGSFTHT